MKAIARALADAARQLETTSDTPLLDAELLLAHAVGVEREQLLLDPPPEIPDAFEDLIARRARSPAAPAQARTGACAAP